MKYYKYVPYVPVLGIFLTAYFHVKYGDTCIAPQFGLHFWGSMFTQVLTISMLVSLKLLN
jgi:hypothetical protein